MKRLFMILGLLLVIGVGSAFVYADSPMGNGLPFNNSNNDEIQQWHEKRMEWKKENLKDGIEKGYITEDEAQAWEEHYDYMEEFHNKNGFYGCHGGKGMGMMKGRHGKGHRMGW